MNNMPRHIKIKLLKISDTEKILKSPEEKRHYYKGTKARMNADFLSEIMQARRQRNNI